MKWKDLSLSLLDKRIDLGRKKFNLSVTEKDGET